MHLLYMMVISHGWKKCSSGFCRCRSWFDARLSLEELIAELELPDAPGAQLVFSCCW